MSRPLLLVFAIGATLIATAGPAAASGGAPELRIEGNRFMDERGAPFRLLGVNRMGAEYNCVSPLWTAEQSRNWFDGPIDDRTITTMTSWKMNAVRLPLNEQC
jgi:hypothetical protein